MKQDQVSTTVLGLDIGGITTRASFFGVIDKKYRLQNTGHTQTALGRGHQIGNGVIGAIQDLQEKAETILLKPVKNTELEIDKLGQVVGQVALVASGGPRLNTVLMGLTKSSSLAAGESLVRSLPLDLAAAFGSKDLLRGFDVLDELLNLRPEMLILTGGEDGGDAEPLKQWVEILRLYCQMVPNAFRPRIYYAGNPSLKETVQRRLEAIGNLRILANIQPTNKMLELVPAQVVIDQEITQFWQKNGQGWMDFTQLVGNLIHTKAFCLDRMVRFINRLGQSRDESGIERGVIALDLGGNSTVLSVGMDGQEGTLEDPTLNDVSCILSDSFLEEVYKWTAVPVSSEVVHQYLCNHVLMPSLIPENNEALAISQATARVRLQRALKLFNATRGWFPYQPGDGLKGNFEPIIVSGGVLTQAPTLGQAMLIVLDGLQPRGITSIILDRHHILPLLGLIGEAQPVLPVQVLDSDAFLNLGSVITAVGDLPEGETLIQVRVKAGSAKQYSVDIAQGTLKRLIVPAGQPVELELYPKSNVDIGFGGQGISGRMKVISGALGVVIDARGRPLRLPQEDESRIEKLQSWLLSMGS